MLPIIVVEKMLNGQTEENILSILQRLEIALDMIKSADYIPY